MAKHILYKLNLPLRKSVLGMSMRPVGILKFIDDDGHVGYGEASPLPGFSKDFFSALEWSKACAVQMSRADGDLKVKIKVNGLIRDASSASRVAKNFHEHGYTHVKVKTASPDWNKILKDIVDQTNLILRLDANQKLSEADALKVIDGIPVERIDYFEDPFPLVGRNYENFFERTGVRYALDSPESAHLYDSDRAGLKYWIIKPTLTGHVPERSNLILSSSYESALGISHLAHACKTNNLLQNVHGLDTLDVYDEPLFPVECEGGTLIAPSMETMRELMDRLTHSLKPVLEF